MNITKTTTENFDNYDVYCRSPYTFMGFIFPIAHQVKLTNVLEADEKTGRVVAQVVNESEFPVYTNGSEDIYLENSVKLLLLVPSMREGFLAAGFRPKVVVSFEKGVRIANRDATISLTVLEEKKIDV